MPYQAEDKTVNSGTVNEQPVPAFKAEGRQSGLPTSPSVARGVLNGSIIDACNQRLDHVCDFVDDIKKSTGLKKFIKAIAKWVREGIRTILRVLGLSDPTGWYANLVAKLKWLAEEIRYIQKEYIQPVIDFEKYVLAVLIKIRAIINWILTLPQRLLGILYKCLQRLIKALASVFFDALAEAAAETPMDDIANVFAAANDVMKATSDLIGSVATAAALAGAIEQTATADLTTPVSSSQLNSANKYIASYEAKYPSMSASIAPTPTQNKSTP